MLIRRPDDIPAREITDRALYLRRRDLLWGATAAAGALWLPGCARADENRGRAIGPVTRGPFGTDEPATDFEKATSYNNFYEFGTDKTDPKRNAGSLRTEPWSVVIEGEVAKPGRIGLEDLLAPHPLEERVYRLRCVEAWSMVIPWVGIPLGAVLARFEPTSQAKYVAFETLVDPEQMPGQRRPILDWPYLEGLRMDEAMNPLAILAVGMYGVVLPNQNGAPLRLVVPWKYGFYANVNPAVDHPRWSQKRERRIGEFQRRETLPFNGYAEQVAALYAGMDPAKLY